MVDNAEATLPTQYTWAFRDNLMLEPQQKNARLIDAVDADLGFSLKGDSFNADFMGQSTPSIIEDRFGPSPEGVVSKSRRVGFFEPFDDGKYVDDIDAAKSLSDATNPTVEAMRAGLNRYRDDKIIATMLGAAREGRTGENTVAFPAAQTIAINDWTYSDLDPVNVPSGNSGLTISKLLLGNSMLGKSEIDGPTYVYASSAQIGQLMRDKSVRSVDFNSVKPLVSGELNTFMGFTFIRGERAPLVAGVRSVLMWKKPAVSYRARQLQDVQIVKRPDRRFNWYAYYKGWHAAARTLDTGVIQVLCAES